MWRVRPRKQKQPGVMNKWESAYGERLELAKSVSPMPSVYTAGRTEKPKTRRSSRKCGVACPTEWKEQCAVVKWAEAMVETNQEPRLLFLVGSASGARLTMGNLMKLKRAGVIKKAWPDLFLAVPTWDRTAPHIEIPGLFIELKRKKGGTLSQEQREMNVRLLEQGYEVCVCKGAEEAIKTIKTYLGI